MRNEEIEDVYNSYVTDDDENTVNTNASIDEYNMTSEEVCRVYGEHTDQTPEEIRKAIEEIKANQGSTNTLPTDSFSDKTDKQELDTREGLESLGKGPRLF